MAFQLILLSLSLISNTGVLADVRFDSKINNMFKDIQLIKQPHLPRNSGPNPENEPGYIRYNIPGTFGYSALEKQRKNDNDQFLRSNIDNQQNQRKVRKEAPRDMMPCRREDLDQEPMVWSRGETVQIPLHWNNPHDSSCEFNAWVDNMQRVAPLKRPFHCGGGWANSRVTVTIPKDFPGCERKEDGCFLQMYGHSVEPRTYAICVNYVLQQNPPATDIDNVSYPGQAPKNLANGLKVPVGEEDIPVTVFQSAVHYWDSYDTSHIDSEYSGYRGQQIEFVRDEVMAAIELASYGGNGGLLKDVEPKELRNKRKALKKKVQADIKKAEKKAKAANKAKQQELDDAAGGKGKGGCFEGELYNIVRNDKCKRQYQNTYVTNVGYRAIMEKYLPIFREQGLTPYTPTVKSVIGTTPHDPNGMKRKGNSKTVIPKNPITVAEAPRRKTIYSGISNRGSGSYNTPEIATPMSPKYYGSNGNSKAAIIPASEKTDSYDGPKYDVDDSITLTDENVETVDYAITAETNDAPVYSSDDESDDKFASVKLSISAAVSHRVDIFVILLTNFLFFL